MIPACFHLAEAVFPRVRAQAARDLVALGWSQSKAAQATGVSQAMVSKYLARPGDEDPVVQRLAADLVREAEGKPVETTACATVHHLTDDDRHDALQDLLAAERLLMDAPPLRVMPQIGLNLARVPESAHRPDEVLAYPARMIRADDRIVVPVAPRAGGSGHLARCLLALRGEQPDVQALANVLGTPSVVEAARHLGWSVAPLPDGDDPDIRFHAALDGKTKVFHDAGAHGLEPCLYIAGADARAVAQAITELNEATT